MHLRDDSLNSFCPCSLCWCVSSGTCDDSLCASCLFFRTNEEQKKMESSMLPILLLPLQHFSLCLSLSLFLSLHDIAVNHTPFSSCRKTFSDFSTPYFKECNLTEAPSGEGLILRCPKYPPAVATEGMKALDALRTVSPSSNLGANDSTHSWWQDCNAFLPPAPASQDLHS